MGGTKNGSTTTEREGAIIIMGWIWMNWYLTCLVNVKDIVYRFEYIWLIMREVEMWETASHMVTKWRGKKIIIKERIYPTSITIIKPIVIFPIIHVLNLSKSKYIYTHTRTQMHYSPAPSQSLMNNLCIWYAF